MTFDVLDKNTKIDDILLCEASAGTGKTFTIEHLFIRRILAFPNKSMKGYALLTFTNAVARELRSRLKAALDKAVVDLRTQNPLASSYLQPYFASQSLRALERAQAELELASIDTIHGFCYRLLSGGKNAEFATGADIIFLIEQFLRTPLAHDELKIVLASFQKDIRALIEALAKELWNDSKQADVVIEYSAEEYSEELLIQATYDYKGLRSKEGVLKQPVAEAIAAFTRFVKQNDIVAIRRHPLFASKLFNDPKVNARPNEQIAFARRLEPLIKQLAHPTYLFEKLKKACREYVSKELKRKNLFAVQELLVRMEEAIQDEATKERIRTQFSCVIVDEFQDTDPIQWHIIETLFLQNWQGALYLVGDPKQAIYGFRNADVYCYMQAKSHKKQHVVTLSKNFRASKRLVDGLNSLFYRDNLFTLPKLSISLEVPPITAGSDIEEITDGMGAIHLFIGETALERKKNWPTEELERTCFFPFIAEEIARLQLPYRSIALLVKDRYQAARLECFLEAQNIPTLSWKKKSVVESEAHLFLERLLACLTSVRDKRCLLSLLLQKPFVGADLEDLEVWAEHVSHLLKLKNALDTRGLAGCVEKFLESVWPGFSHTMRQELWPDQEFLYDLDYLVELACNHQDELLEYLYSLKRFPAYEKEQLTSRYEPDTNGVQILTMHASKGLEFDVVFALGVASRSTQLDEHVDPIELDAEKLRQFYVACTRAKRRLYLPIARQLDQGEISPGFKAPMELFLEKCPQETFGPHITSSTLIPKEELVAVEKVKKALFAPLTLQALPYSANRLRITSFSKEKEESIFYQKKEIAEKLPTGTFGGIILHELLERKSSEGVALTPFEGMEKEVEELIDRAWRVELTGFSLADVAASSIYSEVEFFVKDDEGRTLHGVMDLFFEYQGKWYIIDWKSNALESYSEQALRDEVMRQGYHLQAKLYSDACRAQKYPFGGFYFVFLRGLPNEGVLLYE